jgi:protein SCO1/2
VIDNPQTAPEIELADANGKPFALSQQQGKVTLLFFGFTNCTDICPATLSEMKTLRQQLGVKGNQLTVVLTSVDPQRDTPATLRDYVAAFDPQVIGLTGTEGELEPIWKAYGVARDLPADTTSGDYEVEHSSNVYLVDKQGRLRLTYSFGTPVEDILSDVRYLLKE